jgi:nitrogenase subunit NifH
MAKEVRKLKRAQARGAESGTGDAGSSQRPMMAMPDMGQQIKSLLGRLAIPVVAGWVICGLFAAMVYSKTWKIVLLTIPSLVTLVAAGLVVFALRQAKKASGVASILRNVQTDADRKTAIEQLENASKKNDPAVVFAKAQLEMSEDPRKALATLERIDLAKVMAPVADEARGQRGMIHLMLGEVSEAKTLVSSIELKRHQEPRTRALLAAVSAEAWARSGDGAKATEMLNLFDPEDATFAELKPQLYRARAYAAVHTNDINAMKKALKKLLAQDVRLLGGFMMKRTHPMLQKEAKKLLEQSGQMQRKMVVQRR